MGRVRAGTKREIERRERVGRKRSIERRARVIERRARVTASTSSMISSVLLPAASGTKEYFFSFLTF